MGDESELTSQDTATYEVHLEKVQDITEGSEKAIFAGHPLWMVPNANDDYIAYNTGRADAL